jgi:hypothetical protein
VLVPPRTMRVKNNWIRRMKRSMGQQQRAMMTVRGVSDWVVLVILALSGGNRFMHKRKFGMEEEEEESDRSFIYGCGMAAREAPEAHSIAS